MTEEEAVGIIFMTENNCGEVIIMKKKIVLLAIFVCSLAALLAVSAFATESTVIGSGNCGKDGDNVTFTLYSDGLLKIGGKGEMGDYDYDGGPWFDNNEKIKKIVIAGGVTNIGNRAFMYSSNLTDIEIPSSVTSIGEYAFERCGMTGIEIPGSVKSIGKSAFFSCTKLESLVIPRGVTQIGSYAFDKCTGLKSLKIAGSVTSIGSDVFNSCRSLTSIEIMSGVTSIGGGMFYNCSSLESVKLPYGVTVIEMSAFRNCGKLKSIEIPSSVTSIEDGAFRDCGSLENVYFSGQISDWQSITIGKNNENLTNANINVVRYFNYGDIDDDGMITVSDTILLAKYLAGRSTRFSHAVADVNCDGKLDIKDLIIIQQYLIGDVDKLGK